MQPKIFLFYLLFIIVSTINSTLGQTTLTTGDIVIIGIKESSGDKLKLMTMVDLTCGTKFIISDNQWDSTSDSWPCDASDSEYGAELTVTSKICAGSVILIDDDGNNNFAALSSTGSLTINDLSGNWGTNSGFNSGGDNSFILQGNRTSPSFIFGLKNSGNWSTSIDCNEVDDTKLPDGLTDGINALHFSAGTSARHYDCSKGVSGNKSTLLNKISNTANWTTSGISWTTSSCAFTVTDACTSPNHKPTNFTSNSITETTATIGWSNCTIIPGNTKVLVIARAGAAVTTDPSNGTAYTANPNFGSGTAIGAGYVVFDGLGTSVNLTGLTAGTTYHFSIYEYSCSGNCYNIDDLPGSLGTPASLPVTLIHFQAKNISFGSVSFEWVTSSELNNQKFEIELSADGINFYSIGTVKGKGNSYSIQYYTYTYLINSDDAYARLKQIDYNGFSQYSEVIKISAFENEGIELFPNPANDKLFIKAQINEQFKIIISDLLGNDLYTLDIGFENKNEIHSIDLQKFKSGFYVLHLNSISSIKSKRFLKL